MSNRANFVSPDPHQSSDYVQPNVGGLVSKVSLYARKKMLAALMAVAQPSEATTVLDVGVTCDQREDSNFFEKLYPHRHRVTALGLEDASFLERQYPGVTFVQGDGLRLPFADNSFDLVVSFAVVEHVGDRQRQQAFIQELCRVGRACYVTTPNCWYPVEFHTILPLLHWLPPSTFRRVLRWLGKDFWAAEDNLNLLSRDELQRMFPPEMTLTYRPFRLLGPVSNLAFYGVRQ